MKIQWDRNIIRGFQEINHFWPKSKNLGEFSILGSNFLQTILKLVPYRKIFSLQWSKSTLSLKTSEITKVPRSLVSFQKTVKTIKFTDKKHFVDSNYSKKVLVYGTDKFI